MTTKKPSLKDIRQVEEYKKCCICARSNTVVICIECVNQDLLPSFCYRHMDRHLTERVHKAVFISA